MDKLFHGKIINDVIAELNALNIDMYVILTSEGADPITKLIPGVDTVGSGAFVFTKCGAKIAVTSSIDAQDVEESELFDEVVRYDDYTNTVAQIVKKYAPQKIALNFSDKCALCDGLTVGRYRKFKKSISDINCEFVSSDLFAQKISTDLK